MPTSPPDPRPMRADARRNHDRIVTAAELLVAEQGAEASLEEIARRAGVGSATLHRHFPSRQSLLEAVFRTRVHALCATADTLHADPALSPAAALTAWLHAVAAHATANRGLGTSLMRGTADPTLGTTCHTLITTAGDRLLTAAQQTGAVRSDLTTTHLLTLVGAIALTTETDPDGPARADHLLDLALHGIHAR